MTCMGGREEKCKTDSKKLEATGKKERIRILPGLPIVERLHRGLKAGRLFGHAGNMAVLK